MQSKHIIMLASLLALMLATVPVMAEEGDAAEESINSEADRPSLIELTFYSKDRILLVSGLSADSEGKYILSPRSIPHPPSSTGWQCSNGDFFTHEELREHDFIEEVEQGYTELRLDAWFGPIPGTEKVEEGFLKEHEAVIGAVVTLAVVALIADLFFCGGERRP